MRLCFLLLFLFVSVSTAQAVEITLRTTPPSQAYIDGISVGKTPVLGKKVAPGRHVIRYVLKGEGSQFEFPLNIKAGRSLTCTYHFAKGLNRCATEGTTRASEQGYLTLKADIEADVYIDGQLMGKAPIEKLQVDAGKHYIVFEHPDHKPLEKEIELLTNQHVNVEVTFPKEEEVEENATEPDEDSDNKTTEDENAR